ncbi:IS110 family transposase [Microbispora bryophytorum]|nr:IS110 family transposase [Microbispora bryophytorum]
MLVCATRSRSSDRPRCCARAPHSSPAPSAESRTRPSPSCIFWPRGSSRILALAEEIRAYENALTEIVTDCAPRLLERHGVGPDTAACLLITAGDDPERLNSEAAFAALCGVNPIEASSGKTTRHRSMSSSARSLAHSALCLRRRASSSRSDSAGSPPEPVSCSRASRSICTRWPTFPR